MMAQRNAEDMEAMHGKLINEEYKIWKKNTPFLYDLVMTHALEWPSLTVQWLPESKRVEGADHAVHKMLLGTHTSTGEQNFLMVAHVNLPLPDTEIDAKRYEDERGEVGGFGGLNSKVEVKVRIKHEGEVNRARYMPQNPFLVATKSPSSNVYVFDVTKHPSEPSPNSEIAPDHICKGHTREGYGLAWSLHQSGQLLSGSDDARVCLWDLAGDPGRTVTNCTIFRSHTNVVEDVAWHQHHPHIIGSVGDDKRLILWDVRETPDRPSFVRDEAHQSFINCLAFSPHSEYLLVTGAADHMINLWDMRNLRKSLHTFAGHRDEVYQVHWAPFTESVLASCGADRRVNVWDMSRIGEEQAPEDAEDGPPELLFMHGGHTSKVSDLSWNQDDPWVVASVAEDNILQIWQMADNIYSEEDEEGEGGPTEEDLEGK